MFDQLFVARSAQKLVEIHNSQQAREQALFSLKISNKKEGGFFPSRGVTGVEVLMKVVVMRIKINVLLWMMRIVLHNECQILFYSSYKIKCN